MNDISRRAVVKAGAWAVPVIASSVAIPAHAASGTTQQVVLTNKTAGIGGSPNTLYANYKVKALEGGTGEVVVFVKGERDGQTLFEDRKEWATLPTRGATTEYVGLDFPGIAKGAPVVMTIIVTCGGVYQDGFTKTINTPGWWS